LKGKAWRRLGSGIYRWQHASDDPWLLIAAWRRTLGSDATFSGYTAAWMHGVSCAPTAPIEVIVPLASPARSCFGLMVRHCELAEQEITAKRRLRSTSLMRTLRDICVTKAPVEALVIIDAALRCRVLDLVRLSQYANDATGLPGAARLRMLVRLAAPAESPMETRLRWLFHSAGLPSPEVQKDLYDRNGEFVCRADLYYAEPRLVIEFDGANHKERLVSDDRRQNKVVNAGYRILRFTSSDLFSQPDNVVDQVRGALASGPPSPRFAQIGPKAAA
jgi:hypothetical protein